MDDDEKRKKYEKEWEEFGNSPVMGFFRDLIERMPKDGEMVPNEEKFAMTEKVVDRITEIIRKETPDAGIKAEPDSLTGSSLGIWISTRNVLINKEDVKEFCDLLSNADDIDIAPGYDPDLISIVIGFNNVYRYVPKK
jgi:hypothetical protein